MLPDQAAALSHIVTIAAASVNVGEAAEIVPVVLEPEPDVVVAGSVNSARPSAETFRGLSGGVCQGNLYGDRA